MKALLLLLISLPCAAQTVYGTMHGVSLNAAPPSVVLSPNIGQVGNFANAVQPPVLAFGKQGTGTASMAIPISINNCVSPYIAACGSVVGTVTVSSMTISGTNAADFAITGTCTTIASGASCQPTITFTPSTSSSESATFTEVDSTGTHTMNLTGTGATVTTLATSSCPTALTSGVNYQLTANISCAGAAFTYSGTNDVNLNGYTVTYGTGSQSTQVGAFLLSANNGVLTVHNGTVTKGSGTNTFSTGTQPQSSMFGVEPNGGSEFTQGNGGALFNLTVNMNMQYANVLEQYIGSVVVHDLVINDTAVGTCASVGCRNVLQSATLFESEGQSQTSGATQIYNVTQNGGPQGGFGVDAVGAVVDNNYINPGNATGTNTNNFAIFEWGTNEVAQNNIIELPVGAASGTRGINLGDPESRGASGMTASHNYVGAFQPANNTEYGGCQGGGAFAEQVDNNPPSGAVFSGNTVVGTATVCSASGLRITDSESLSNGSTNEIISAVRGTGAIACTPGEWSEAKPGCAYALSVDADNGVSVQAATITNAKLTGDSGCFFVGPDGANQIYVESSTCNKGSNPSGFHTITAQNGPSSAVQNFHIVDATFNTGTSPTDTFISAQGANQGAVSFFVDWTQNMTVEKASGPAASGALVTFTDTLSNTYTCTTSGGGACSVAVTQYRDNNDTGANQVENRNPFSLSVSLAGCTTFSQSGITISATTSRAITLSGC